MSKYAPATFCLSYTQFETGQYLHVKRGLRADYRLRYRTWTYRLWTGYIIIYHFFLQPPQMYSQLPIT